MEADLAQVVQLIQALYSPSTSPADQAGLQLRLQEVQSSDAAWSIVGPLLSQPDPSVRFFAASTLQLKISRSWPTLPASHYDSLKSSLLSWLSISAAQAYPGHGAARAGERVVLRKLASAVTSLSLRLEDWEDWLLEVVVRVSAGDGTAGGGSGREAVLEVLAVVIEQVARAELVGTKRSAYMAKLASSTPHLVSTLSSSLASPTASSSEINSALSCFTSYLLSGQFSHTELTTLYPLLLRHLSNSETTIAACTAVEEIVERSSGASSSGGAVRFIGRAKVDELVRGWATSEWVRGIVGAAVDEGEADDEALAVMKLLCAISEHLITFLFAEPPKASAVPVLTFASPEVRELFVLLLAITSFPGHTGEAYNINEMAGGVWMAMQEESMDAGLVFGEGEGREGRRGREAGWEFVRTVFSALADSLRQRSQWPSFEVVSEWPKDVTEAFRVYRSTTLSDYLLYAYYVLRYSMLGGLVNLAGQQVSRPLSSPTDGREDLEATLFCLYAIEEAVPSDEPTHLSNLFGPILSHLPSAEFISLRSTTLRLVGSHSPWFVNQPEACMSAVSFVVAALGEQRLAPAAAKALRMLCDYNRKQLVGHVASFVTVLGGLVEGQVEDAELLKVLESVSSVIQALPPDQIVEPLVTLAYPIVDKLESSIQAYAQLPTEARDLCLQQLAYLSACAKGLSDPDGDLVDLDSSFDDSVQPINATSRILADERIIGMRNRLGSAIENVARIWGGDVEVVQALSEYIRHSTSDANPSPLALDSFSLLSLGTSALQTSISSVWLSIAASLLVRLARDQNDFQLTEEDLAKVGRPVEAVLTTLLSRYADLAAMDENPDVVQAFLSFCNTIVRSYPRIFIFLPTHLEAIITFAERGLGMQERFSLKATIDLLISSVQQTKMASPSSVVFRQTLLPHTPAILHSLMLSISGGVPRSHLTTLSELLHACILRMPDETRAAIKELLATPNWPTSTATQEAKTKFERAITTARTGKQARGAVSDFAMVCRGLDGSAYGAASLAAFD